MPTTKKVTANQKVTPKKVVSTKKKPVGRKLIYANDETSFWTSDGQILNSLTALRDALAVMNKAVYMHHVTKDRNDFANWVEKVLGDKKCATDLRQAKSTGGAKLIVIRHLKEYTL